MLESRVARSVRRFFCARGVVVLKNSVREFQRVWGVKKHQVNEALEVIVSQEPPVTVGFQPVIQLIAAVRLNREEIKPSPAVHSKIADSIRLAEMIQARLRG